MQKIKIKKTRVYTCIIGWIACRLQVHSDIYVKLIKFFSSSVRPANQSLYVLQYAPSTAHQNKKKNTSPDLNGLL